MRSRILHFLLVALFVATGLLSAAAQQQSQEPKAPDLNETQQLQLDNLRKDFRIADQQVQLLKVQLAESMRAQQLAQNRFWTYVADLRTKMKAPEADFDFDANNLRFVPKKKQAAAGK